MPDQDLQPLITALAEAPCSKCKGTSCAAADEHGIITDWTPCSDCNGTGRNPLTELLRVKCSNIIGAAWPHSHGQSEHNKHCWGRSKERCETHRATCPGHRPATPEEAEAVGLKLLVAFNLEVGQPFYDPNEWHAGQLSLLSGIGSTPLEAILKAAARMLRVEVPDPVTVEDSRNGERTEA